MVTEYEVTVRGDYFANTPMGKVKKPFVTKVKINSSIKERGYLSVIRKYLLIPMLERRYDDFKLLRTAEIYNAKNISNPGQPVDDIDLMSYNELIKLIEKNKYRIDVDLFPDSFLLRQAIAEYTGTPSEFLAYQEMKQSRMKNNISVYKLLRDLNPDILGDEL